MEFGGGLDIPMTKSIQLPVPFKWTMWIHFGSNHIAASGQVWQANFKYVAGEDFTFGGKLNKLDRFFDLASPSQAAPVAFMKAFRIGVSAKYGVVKSISETVWQTVITIREVVQKSKS